MDKINRIEPLHPSLCEVVTYGELDSVPVDQASAMDFNIDPATGFPMSDITAILRADAMTQRVKLADLQEFKADFLPADVTDEDALKYYQPRLAQLPSELAELSEDIAKQRYEEYKKGKEIKDSEEEAKLYKDWLDNYLTSQKSKVKVESLNAD